MTCRLISPTSTSPPDVTVRGPDASRIVLEPQDRCLPRRPARASRGEAPCADVAGLPVAQPSEQCGHEGSLEGTAARRGEGQARMQASEVPRAVAAAISTASSLDLTVDEAILLHDSNKL